MAQTTRTTKSAETASAPDAKKHLADTVEDGEYEGDGAYRGDFYRTVAFTKRGSSAVGYVADPYDRWCFQGTIDGNVIHVTNAVDVSDEWENGRKTGRQRFKALSEKQKPNFQTFRMTGLLDTHPRFSSGILKAPPHILERDRRWMNVCVQYYAGRVVEPPPCGDEALRGTDENEGTAPKYRATSTVCTITKETQYVALIKVAGAVCSVQNVFDVLIRTPSAIAPTIDEAQAVENCGVLQLMSVTSPNEIKVEIDKAHHRVLNHTLPGHKFYPGRVVRQIVEEDGMVKVVTTGTGTLAFLKNVENKVESVPIWLAVDQRLKVMFARAHKAADE